MTGVYVLGDPKAKFECRFCRKTYKHYASLWRHIKHECGKEPQFECTLCGKKFTQKSSLTSHIGLKHAAIWS